MYNRDVCYSSFGWKHDMTAFLVGRYLYKKDGVYEASGTEELETMSDNLRPSPKGSFTEWRRLASHCFAPECEPQGLAILGSMGSPLVKAIFPANEGGCVMSLVSHGSGQGKSTALTAAESVWGQPLCLSITKTSSQVAKFKFAALTGDLPMFIDEYGDNDIKITHDF